MTNIWINKNNDDFSPSKSSEEQFLLFNLFDKRINPMSKPIWNSYGEGLVKRVSQL